MAELRRALRSMPDLERALGGARNAASAPPLALPPAILSTLQKKCAQCRVGVSCSAATPSDVASRPVVCCAPETAQGKVSEQVTCYFDASIKHICLLMSHLCAEFLSFKLFDLHGRRLAALGTAVQAIKAAVAALQDFDAAAADEATAVLRGATDAARRCGEGPAAEVLELVEEALIWPDRTVSSSPSWDFDNASSS